MGSRKFAKQKRGAAAAALFNAMPKDRQQAFLFLVEHISRGYSETTSQEASYTVASEEELLAAHRLDISQMPC